MSYDDDGPRYSCRVCFDGFWESVWCPGSGPQRVQEKPERHHGLLTVPCQHPRPHGPHSAARRCGCVEDNPAIAKQRERQREFVTRKARA